jgi:CRISPR-associated protein Cmr6
MKGFEIGSHLTKQDLPGLHLGLALGGLAPVGLGGKVPDERRSEWLETLADISVLSDYASWFEHRWKRTIGRAVQGPVEAKGRLLVGAGDPSAVAAGLRVHHTWGVPFIPGSALKGILSHWLDTVYGPSPDNDSVHPWDPAHPEPDRAKFRRPRTTSKPAQGAGEIQRILFGSPEIDADRKPLRDWGGQRLPDGTTACRGRIVIHDALFVPGSANDRPFLPDVLTVHHAAYYRGEGSANDHESPNPVGFLTVRPESQFLVAVQLAPGEDAAYEPWVDFAHGLLLDALADWGAGSKTAAGYGRLEKVGRHARAEQPADEKREELTAWLEANVEELRRLVDATDGGPSAFVQRLVDHWGTTITAAAGETRRQRKRAIESFVANDLNPSKSKKKKEIRTKLNEVFPD